MQPQVDLRKADTVPFNVKAEPWVKYKLEDSTVITARFILTKLYKTGEYDPSGQPIYGWSSQTLITTMVEKEKKGTPSQPPPTSGNPADYEGEPIDFERAGPEQWNIYELDDGSLLRVKLEITSIIKTNKFGVDGDPFYMVFSQTVSRVKVPPSLMKKRETRVPREADVYK